MRTRVIILTCLVVGLSILGLIVSCNKTMPTETQDQLGDVSPYLGKAIPTPKDGDLTLGGRAGTTLLAEVTAECMRDYDWTIEKTMEPSVVTIAEGEFATVDVTVNVTRTLTESIDGIVCAENGGERATEGFHIEVTVLCRTVGVGGAYEPCFGPYVVDVSSNPILDPGESDCYAYSVPMAFDDGKTYKVNADVTILNHSGRLGEPFGPHPDSESFHACEITDLTATVTDECGGLEGFTCTVEPEFIIFDDEGTGTFSLKLFNESAECGLWLEYMNTAVLEEGDSYSSRIGRANLSTYTGDCTGGEGCTYTQGYWKTHPLDWPVTNLTLGTVYYDQAQLLDIFHRSVHGNGLVSLAHQLIAAKLNVANGADGSCVIDAIADADALIGELLIPPVGDGYLETWVTDPTANILDDYNNGIIGPGHCD
ncbi:hypothetical protein JXI42_00290 [bacterium]|nr:hypothetical protein [bacterium]